MRHGDPSVIWNSGQNRNNRLLQFNNRDRLTQTHNGNVPDAILPTVLKEEKKKKWFVYCVRDAVHGVHIYFEISKFHPTFAKICSRLLEYDTVSHHLIQCWIKHATPVKVNNVACCLKCLSLLIAYSLRWYFNRQHAVNLANVAKIILFRLTMVYGDADYNLYNRYQRYWCENLYLLKGGEYGSPFPLHKKTIMLW